jgi:hypothetical protein
MNAAYELIVKNWKSSVSSLLTVAVAISGVFLAVDITGGKAGNSSVIFVASAVCKVLLGLIQKDATTLVLPAGTEPVVQVPEGATLTQTETKTRSTGVTGAPPAAKL